MRKRYEVLDGLRGVAAIAVLVLHVTQEFQLSWTPVHAALAVDFFFCLSGFVVAHAYDQKFAAGSLDFGGFARRRIERLYPMILAGALLGGLMMALSATHGFPRPLWQVALLTSSAALLLPVGAVFGMKIFPVNDPLWSLLFEGLANVVYGVTGGRKLSRGVVAVALGLAAAAVIVGAVLADGVADLGWRPETWLLGGPARVAYPFLAGVLIARLGLANGRQILPGYILAGLLMLLLFGPKVGPAWLFDSLAILLAVPGLVIWGARVAPHPAADKLWRFLGEISYPLYAIHLPVIVGVTKLQNRVLHLESQTLVVVLALIVPLPAAWLAMRCYDEPVRAWFARIEWRRRVVAAPAE